MTPIRFPNEGKDYRAARDDLLTEEIELRARIERVAALRRRLPPGGAVPQDYEFDELDGARRPRGVKLSELFAEGKDSHFWGSEVLYAGLPGNPRHVDLLWPLWNVFDTAPDGRGDGYPTLDNT